jgi:hypothetical protein
LLNVKDWVEKNADPKELEEMKQNPEIAKWFEYDLSSFFPIPDIYLDDHQTYTLGESKIVTFLTAPRSIPDTASQLISPPKRKKTKGSNPRQDKTRLALRPWT